MSNTQLLLVAAALWAWKSGALANLAMGQMARETPEQGALRIANEARIAADARATKAGERSEGEKIGGAAEVLYEAGHAVYDTLSGWVD